jgi:Tol biopolymer transport system component
MKGDRKPGDLVGPYRIQSLIRRDASGAVYRTLDTRNGLRSELITSEAPFSDRFQSEARAAAALDHPHIRRIFEVGPDYVAMEFLEGSPLDAALKAPLPKAQALKYADQLCDALEAAHREGVFHRDLKTGNILVTGQGIKLLDLGLGSENQTGKTDARSDVYGLGCMLYRLLTGRPVTADRTPVAQPLEAILETCLRNDPDERWQSVGELRHALRWATEAGTAIPAAGGTNWLRVLSLAAVAALAAAVGAWALFHARQPQSGQVMRLQLAPPPGTHFLVEENLGGFALSPDGKLVAFVTSAAGKNEMWVQPLEGAQARRLPGAENAIYPFFSPDGKSIGFVSGGKLRRIDADGGALTVICDVGTNYGGAVWTEDNRIVFSTDLAGLLQVPASGGTVTPLTVTDPKSADTSHIWPQVLPRGNVLYSVQSDKPGGAGVYAVSLSRPLERSQLLHSNTNAMYAEAAGRSLILWLRGTTLVAQDFDLRSLKLSGEPRPLADPVSHTGPPEDRMNVAIPAAGILLYRASGSRNTLSLLDRTGKPVAEIPEPGDYTGFIFSPDGRRIAAVLKSGDLSLIDTERGVSSPFTFDARNNSFPVWSPDGATLVFHRGDHELVRKPSSGLADEEVLLRSQTIPNATDWSRDGRTLLYFEISSGADGKASRDIWTMPVTPEGRLAPGGKPAPWTHTPFNEKNGRFSPEPNPRRIAYQSDESGRYEIYADTFPAPRGKIRISTNGGQYPEWAPGGREIFFVSPTGEVMSAAVKGVGDSLSFGEPVKLFRVPAARFDPISPSYELAPDGKRFLVRSLPQQTSEALSVIVNWPALLNDSPVK